MGEYEFSDSSAHLNTETLILNGKATPSVPVVLVDPSKKPEAKEAKKAAAKDGKKADKKEVHWTINLALGNKKIRVTTIDKAGLLPAFENPEPFEAAVLSFLK